MKICLLTDGGPLDERRVARGNSVRRHFLARYLRELGHEVMLCHPGAHHRDDPGAAPPHFTYADPVALGKRLRAFGTDVLIVGYVPLMSDVPSDFPGRVVLDMAAPRFFETLFESRRAFRDELSEAMSALRRAHGVLAGNDRQKAHVLTLLGMAGADLSRSDPVHIAPLCGEPATQEARPKPGPINVIAAGYRWPWRRDRAYREAWIRHAPREWIFTERQGAYHPEAQREPDAAPSRLLPYGAYRAELCAKYHLGWDLSEPNVERFVAQSFRSVDYLLAGLPVIIGADNPLSAEVTRFGAGWAIDGEAALLALIEALEADPGTLRVAGEGAVVLAHARLDYRVALRGLCEYLERLDSTPLARGPTPVSPWETGDEASDAGSGLRARARPLLAIAKRKMARRLAGARALGPGDGSVVIVTRSDLFPADHGAAVKIDRTAWGLSLAVPRVAIVTDERRHYYLYREGRRETRRFPRPLRWLGLPRPLATVLTVLKGVPLSNALLYRPEVDRSQLLRTLWVAGRIEADVFQAEFPAYMRICLAARELLGGRAILVEHNVEYRRIAEQEPALSRAAQRWLRAKELDYAARADAVIAVSQRDRSTLIADGLDPAKVHVVPHGVDLESFRQAEPLDLRAQLRLEESTPILVFHGTYRYPPNLEAMEVAAKHLLPRLERRRIEPVILALGRYPPRRSFHPRLRFLGPVEAVAPYLKAADLAIIPLLGGGGTRMKALDYFAARVPVVSTTKGMEGIPVTDGVEVSLADDWDAFAGAVAELLADPARASALSDAAYRLVEGLDWREIAARYLALMRS